MTTVRAWLLGLCFVAAGMSVSRAQSLTYRVLPFVAGGPSARVDGTIAYDAASRRVYLFGGQDSTARNDLWTYSVPGRAWNLLSPGGDAPAPRFGHTLVFDSARRRLILFGGQASGFFSDVWAYDIEANAWRMLAGDAAGPSRRYGHSAVYDPTRDQMVISHGFTNSGRFDDTWAFRFATNSWTNVSPGGARPVRRCLHHAVLDAEGSAMYLYGGCASGFGPCPLADLWIFDLTTNRWTEVTGGARPPAREHYGIGFDSVRRRLLLFGGSGAGLLNDTWVFDAARRQWSEAVLDGPPPSRRSRHESASAEGVAYFFGGRTEQGSLTNELWTLGPAAELRGPQLTQSGVGHGFSGEPAPVAPGQVVSLYGDNLGPAEPIMAMFDPGSGRLPVSLAGVSASWNGIPAPLFFVSARQINLQVPYEVAGSASARLMVTVNGESATPVDVPLAASRPGLFPRVWNADGTINAPDSAIERGGIVVLYASGQGVTTPPSTTGAPPSAPYPEPQAPVSVSIGGQSAEILFQGQAPGTAGVMQINMRLPGGLGPGRHALALTIGAGVAPPVDVFVR
jgi:uncharacterized protein (TIGR03437 family)